jgi:phosphoglycerate kinase
MSLKPVAAALARSLGAPVAFVETDWADGRAAQAAAKAKAGDVLLFENTRFAPGEEKNDAALARQFAALGDVYVNDAFSAAHRAHASTEGVAHLLPSVAGRAMEAELGALEAALAAPKRPLVAVVGGAKISTKLDLLENLSGVADTIVIGGAMANTFLAAQGFKVGKSLCEHDLAETARGVLAAAKAKGCTILLPVDAVVAGAFKAGAPSRIVNVDALGDADMILDIGPKSVEAVTAAFDRAKTIVWNGPLGAFEIAPFDAATVRAARHAAALVKAGKVAAIAGGGDTVAALNHAGVADDFTYVSTAGGAFLEWLEGKTLPGVAALANR